MSGVGGTGNVWPVRVKPVFIEDFVVVAGELGVGVGVGMAMMGKGAFKEEGLGD